MKTSVRLALALFLLTLILWFMRTGGLVSWGTSSSIPSGWAAEHPFDIPPQPLNDSVVVVGRLKHEDTNWVIDELPE